MATAADCHAVNGSNICKHACLFYDVLWLISGCRTGADYMAYMDVVKVCHVKRIYFSGILVQANV